MLYKLSIQANSVRRDAERLQVSQKFQIRARQNNGQGLEKEYLSKI